MRNASGEVLFIDARKLGTLVDRTRKEFSDDDVAKISRVYHAWREGKGYEDVSSFCKCRRVDARNVRLPWIERGRRPGDV
jgi:type I restriction enzyme M protein